LGAVWRKTTIGIRAFGNHSGSVRRPIIEDFFLRLAFLQKRLIRDDGKKDGDDCDIRVWPQSKLGLVSLGRGGRKLSNEKGKV
jgi:hypothetical protein